MTGRVVQIGPELQLEIDERRLVHRGEALELRGRPFDVLVVLAQQMGSLVAHAELLDRVWSDTVVEPNNVAHNISILRKALRSISGVSIKTVQGRGYRLVVDEAASASPRRNERFQQVVGFCRSADGYRLAHATAGEGPPLVKVANWLSHVEIDWGSPLWTHWLSLLTDGRRAVRYDARGNGLSEWNVEVIDFERFVSDLGCVMDDTGIERAPLLGISQGAAVAAAFAARYPERVSALVLIGGCVRGWRTKGHAALTEQFEALLTLMRLGWGRSNPAFRQIFTTAFFPEASPEQMTFFNELQRQTASPENAARILEAVGNLDIREELPRVRAPTLVLHSRRDAVVPFRDGMELAAGIPGARFVTLDSPNHVLLENEPAWTRLRAEVSEFLTAHAGS